MSIFFFWHCLSCNLHPNNIKWMERCRSRSAGFEYDLWRFVFFLWIFFIFSFLSFYHFFGFVSIAGVTACLLLLDKVCWLFLLFIKFFMVTKYYSFYLTVMWINFSILYFVVNLNSISFVSCNYEKIAVIIWKNTPAKTL